MTSVKQVFWQVRAYITVHVLCYIIHVHNIMCTYYPVNVNIEKFVVLKVEKPLSHSLFGARMFFGRTIATMHYELRIGHAYY